MRFCCADAGLSAEFTHSLSFPWPPVRPFSVTSARCVFLGCTYVMAFAQMRAHLRNSPTASPSHGLPSLASLGTCVLRAPLLCVRDGVGADAGPSAEFNHSLSFPFLPGVPSLEVSVLDKDLLREQLLAQCTSVDPPPCTRLPSHLLYRCTERRCTVEWCVRALPYCVALQGVAGQCPVMVLDAMFPLSGYL